MNDDEIHALLAQAWESMGQMRADLAAAQTLLKVCLDLLRDDPRFADSLTQVANAHAALMLNSPIKNEAFVDRFMVALSAMTPEEHRHLLNG